MTNSMGSWLREAMELRGDGRLVISRAALDCRAAFMFGAFKWAIRHGIDRWLTASLW